MSTHRFLLSLVAVLPLVIGCTRSDAPTLPPGANLVDDGLVTARLASSELRSAEQVGVVFTNRSATNLGVNTCERRVDRLVNAQWVAYPPELRLCAAALDGLPRQGSLTTTADVPLDAVSGEHRFRFVVRQIESPGAVSEVVVHFTVR